MLFNSVHFVLFFPLVVGLYFTIPHRFRWILLLSASYYFYMCWNPKYVLLIFASTVVAYFAAILMEKEQYRRIAVVAAIGFNLGLLFIFKYFNFFSDSVLTLLNQVNIFYEAPTFKLLLPVGISFYTFQLLSYSIDVYKGNKKAERHFGIFALYVSFFPQLAAGPIERSTTLLPQFFEKHDFEYQRVVDGLKLMAWGFIKKLVIADRLASIVDVVYNNPTDHTGVALLVASFFFCFQAYCDFSGYSDIAIGSAQVMGFQLMQNFNRPFHARSVSEFWRRWHISLSTWVKDYMFAPLTIHLRNWGLWGSLVSLVSTFTIIGLWHGASWHYVVFGLLHGGAISLEVLTKKQTKSFRRKFLNILPEFVYDALCLVSTFVFVAFTLIIFRANTVSDAIYIVSHLFTDLGWFLAHVTEFGQGNKLLGEHWYFTWKDIFFAFFAILCLETVHVLQTRVQIRVWLEQSPIWVRWPLYYAALYVLVYMGEEGVKQFIYFQF